RGGPRHPRTGLRRRARRSGTRGEPAAAEKVSSLTAPCPQLAPGADQLGPLGPAVLLQPVGVDQPRRVVLGVGGDVLQESLLQRHRALLRGLFARAVAVARRVCACPRDTRRLPGGPPQTAS